MADQPAFLSNDDPKIVAVCDALRDVMDPEIGISVIELGLVRDLDILTDKAEVEMIMTTPFCPYAPALLESVRKTTEDTAGVPTTIEMGSEMWSTEMMEEGAGGDWGLF